jgi:hypothetical protein
MLVSDVISRVRKSSGDEDVLQFTDATVRDWINDAAKECASENLLLQKTATQVVTAGTTDYALPTDILKLHSVRYDNEKIRLMDMNEFDEKISGFGETTRSTPTLGYVWAGKLVIYPAPDNSTKSLAISYTRTPAEVVANGDSIDLPAMYHRRIVDYCLAQVAEQDDDENRYQLKMEEFRSGISALKDQQEWEQDAYPMITVSDRDGGGELAAYYE